MQVTQKILTFFFVVSRIILNFVADSKSPIGAAGQILLEKGRLRRYLRRADLANQSSEDSQPERPLWVYCTLLAIFGFSLNIPRRGLVKSQGRNIPKSSGSAWRLRNR